MKGGKIGRLVHLFNPVEIWTRKMNREIILFVRQYQPELILVFGNFQILTGTLACIKTMCPEIKLGWVWPDTPMNLEKHNILNAPLFDISAIYSREALPVMRQLGSKTYIGFHLQAIHSCMESNNQVTMVLLMTFPL